MTDEELIARLRAVDVSWSQVGEDCAAAADLIAALLAQNAAQEARIEAMDAQYVEILGYAKAQKDRAEAAEGERDEHRRNWEKAFHANTALEARIAALTAQVEKLQRDLDDTTVVAENFTDLVRCKGGRIRNAGNSGYVCFICGVDTSIGEKCRAAITEEPK